jgi:hypothetical protein
MLSEPVLLGLISAGGPAVIVILIWLRDRQGAQAQAVSDLSTARRNNDEGEASLSQVTLAWATQLRDDIASLKDEVAGLRGQVADLEKENRLLRRHNEQLVDQVIGLGGVPVDMPS